MMMKNSFAEADNKNLNSKLLLAMKMYKVPVVGYAIIKQYKIIAVNTLSIDPKLQVTNESLFQAASISKSVSTYTALKLISQGKLKLDEPVNNQLTSWKIPINKYNKNYPVTLRQILDMTSGLSVSGFSGYKQGTLLPTLDEILDGKPPANNPPVRVFYKPGSQYFYSGGAFQVLQKLIEDSTQEAFAYWMNREVLKPLNMDNSIFQCPLNIKKYKNVVPGFLINGSMIQDGWYNYPVAAAGGLWTTPSDLAKFIIGLSKAYLHTDNQQIAKPIAAQMFQRQKNTDYGFGFVVNGQGRTLNIRKAGHNFGYHSEIIMFPNTGDGAVIMTNSENGEYIINYMIPIIAQQNDWPCYFPFFDELITIPKTACV